MTNPYKNVALEATITVVLREIKNNAYAKFGEANKVSYGTIAPLTSIFET